MKHATKFLIKQGRVGSRVQIANINLGLLSHGLPLSSMGSKLNYFQLGKKTNILRKR